MKKENFRVGPKTELSPGRVKIVGGGRGKPVDAEVWGPFRPLPNVSKFTVKLSKFDELYQSYGIKRRMPVQLDYKPHRNKGMNDYFDHQLRRMKQASDEDFWKIATWLLRHSNVMLLLALQHVVPKWHRNYKLGYIKRVLYRTRQLALSDSRDLEFYRVWIPKSKPGALRPLGCPSLEWRLYLHMLNQLIVLRAIHKRTIPDCQHGFVPGRGTLTAWLHILRKVIWQKDIYEIDLRSFFDFVDNNQIEMELPKVTGMPRSWASRIWEINLSPVVPAAVHSSSTAQETEDFLRWDPTTEGRSKEEVLRQLSAEKGLRRLSEPYRRLKRQYPNINWWMHTEGVPQGSATSCFLACLMLRPLIEKTRRNIWNNLAPRDSDEVRDLIGYADDWIIYGQNYEIDYLNENILFDRYGIEINQEKSQWVKRNGEWLKPLRFLGLSYDGREDKLRASTRSGADLIFDKQDLVTAIASRESLAEQGHSFKVEPRGRYLMSSEALEATSDYYETLLSPHADRHYDIPTSLLDVKRYDPETSTSRTDWEEFIESSITGFLQSRMYQDSWNMKEFIQSFELSYEPGSWVDYYKERPELIKLDVFNSTSYAYNHLASELSVWFRNRRKQ
jgi:hypothetical protein